MAGIYTPTPFQNALFDPRKPLQQLAEKKCPCALAHVRVTRAREKLHYGILFEGKSRGLLTYFPVPNCQGNTSINAKHFGQIYVLFEVTKVNKAR